jgi:hypothetical protein
MNVRANTPHLTPIKNGWAAVGHGWAVFAPSRDEALNRYEQAERKHDEIREREATPAETPIGHEQPS